MMEHNISLVFLCRKAEAHQGFECKHIAPSAALISKSEKRWNGDDSSDESNGNKLPTNPGARQLKVT